MRKALVTAAAMLLFSSLCAADEMGITVRAADGAALIAGEEESVRAVEAALNASAKKKWFLREIEAFITAEHGDRVKIRLYSKLEFERVGMFRFLRMPLRRAVLRGDVPPIEFLSFEQARAVLEGFDIGTAAREDFEKLTDEQKVGAAALAGAALVVLGGTGPDSPVEIVYVAER
ncbi:MAG: hypothetical protein AB1742_12550 [bacterium]